MATCTKEVEIELSTEKVVDVTLKVEGCYDPSYGADADGNRGEATWFVDNWDDSEYETEGLTEKEISELKDKIEELVLEESWDFGTAKDDEEADSYERDED